MFTYFAHITADNVVDEVIVADQQFVNETYGANADQWVETFIDTPGKTYAGVGYTWDDETQDFVAPPEPVEP